MSTRRLEFVKGKSAKFWTAGIEGNTLVVVYGKIGTQGRKIEKVFDSQEDAQKQFHKSFQEKQQKGYIEVGALSKTPPIEEKPPEKPVLSPRYEAKKPSEEDIHEAIKALESLKKVLGKRSWQVSHQSKKARRALEKIAGYTPSSHSKLSQILDELLQAVPKKDSERSHLPIRIAMNLLTPLDISAFSHAMSLWKNCEGKQKGVVDLLQQQINVIEDPEIAFRLGKLLLERPDINGSSEAGWKKRWRYLSPFLVEKLQEKDLSLKKHVQNIDTTQLMPHVALRVSRLS